MRLSTGWLLLAMFGFLALASGARADDAKAKPVRTKVAVLVFPGVELLDFAGPAEIFATCRDADGERLFEVYSIGINKKPAKSLSFLTITPEFDPTDAPAPDVVVIPGGNVLEVMDNPAMMKWLGQQAKDKKLIFSVCNGASVLAKLGLLDGIKTTTHHGNFEILQLLAPKTICLRDRRFIDNGQIITAAGVSAGIDGALYLVARLKGVDAAERSATYAEFDYWGGFRSKDAALPKPDKDGVISQSGRVHGAERTWAVMALLEAIRERGQEAALEAYPKMLSTAKGHDREMIEEEGLSETAVWLMKHSREPEVGLSILRFIAAAHPKSSKAQERLGRAYLQLGNKKEARSVLERAVELDPKNEDAEKALKECGK